MKNSLTLNNMYWTDYFGLVAMLTVCFGIYKSVFNLISAINHQKVIKKQEEMVQGFSNTDSPQQRIEQSFLRNNNQGKQLKKRPLNYASRSRSHISNPAFFQAKKRNQTALKFDYAARLVAININRSTEAKEHMPKKLFFTIDQTIIKENKISMNRTYINRVANADEFDAFKEGEIELREHTEVPVVSKEARIVEEVSLGKESNERSETIRDTVRKTEMDK